MLGAYFFAPPPFTGSGSVFHQPLLLSVCYESSLFVFQFYGEIWLWVLLTGSGDELCDTLPALLQGVAYPPPAFSLHCLSSVCLLIVCTEISSSLLLFDYNSLFVIQFFLGGSQSAQGLC
jgi:hypothetical protein